MTPRLRRPVTDGVVTLRPPVPDDTAALVAGRDAEFRRFLGDGDPDPRPLACIEVAGEVVGWVDHDQDRSWLLPGEVNVGYSVVAAHRGRGHATRAVQLLMHHLAVATDHRVATLLIDAANERSLALARRARFPRVADLDGHPYFKRPVPPLTYSDDVVVLRPVGASDLDRHLQAADDAQIDWLWAPGEREEWESMTSAEQRVHMRRYLRRCEASFGEGPSWTFAVDTAVHRYVGYVEADLASPDVPAGEANVSYAVHPAHRGRGHASRGVTLLAQFLRDHTAARTAHLVIDEENTASRRIAAAVGASESERWVNERGRTMIRHLLAI